MEWMILPLRRYFDFSGRSRRKEYWMFVLFCAIVRILLLFLDNMLGLGGQVTRYFVHQPGAFGAGGAASGGILSGIFSLAVIIPTIAVGVRRLHDIDRTGWWMLAFFLAFALGGLSMVAGGVASMLAGGALILVGGVLAILLIVWACLDGTRGSNRFGPDPKGGSDLSNLQDTFR
ncbi:MAG TPA: DUF805 domain-containing protein [Sphingomonas sp.]